MEEENEIWDGVEAAEMVEEDDSDGGEIRPIMLLLHRLVKNKQNTVMTNAQIIDILQCEFGIDVNSNHELEVDIYINIIKKYLKDWPQWEELESMSAKLNNTKDFEAEQQALNQKYNNLKEYLGVMLEAAKPLAKEALKSIKPKCDKTDENIDSNEVVMEITCTREQLIHLFYRHPRLYLNNTVFNLSTINTSYVKPLIPRKPLTFNEIMNLWCTKININLPHFTYIHELMYKLKHKLLNKARDENSSHNICFDSGLQIKPNKRARFIYKHQVMKQFNDILEECLAKSDELYAVVLEIFNILQNHLQDAPDFIKIPSHFRKFANKYKYVKYLYVENDQCDDLRYDLQLEEIASPTYQYYIGKVGQLEKPLPPIDDWLKIECMMCKIKFPGSVKIKEILQSHYNDQHKNEPDWQCTHCERSFSMEFLSNNKWCHEC